MFAISLIQSGLTFEEIISDVPHDAAAIFVYALLAGTIYVIWRASRRPRA